MKIGIRRENKGKWEKRAPLTPAQVEELLRSHEGVEVVVEPSDVRCFSDEEYEKAGAKLGSVEDCDVILGVKEVKVDYIYPNKIYFFFSHTIKGQPQNMEMLKKLVEERVTLVDYETITDEEGRRLIFFGRYAGLAGAIESLRGYGLKLRERGIDNLLAEIPSPFLFKEVSDAKKFIRNLLASRNFEEELKDLLPLKWGISGYGNVSKGAQEILRLLPLKEVEPDELENFNEGVGLSVIKEEHIVKRKEGKFDLQEYYKYPERYEAIFAERYGHHFDFFINAIYWDERYPRLYTREYFKEHERPIFIGDISCDLNGAVEITNKTTTPGNPFYTYIPQREEYVNGVAAQGTTVMAVDILPSEFPYEATRDFGRVLLELLPSVLSADWSVDFESLEVDPRVKRGIILYKGEFTPRYSYMKEFIK